MQKNSGKYMGKNGNTRGYRGIQDSTIGEYRRIQGTLREYKGIHGNTWESMIMWESTGKYICIFN